MQFTDAISNSDKFTGVNINKRSSQSCKQVRGALAKYKWEYALQNPQQNKV